ncbi:MAG: rhodanese-like domain-containing protein [Candidatus Dojkabacteria bacterium]
MNSKITLLAIVIVIAALFGLLYFSTTRSGENEQAADTSISYEDIGPEEFNEILGNSDPFVIDVHTPEQAHIEGTDAFIDYAIIDEQTQKLPADKDTEILVYCRSGNMSGIASEKLIEMGYTNVRNLAGGVKAWEAAGYELNPDLIGTFN